MQILWDKHLPGYSHLLRQYLVAGIDQENYGFQGSFHQILNTIFISTSTWGSLGNGYLLANADDHKIGLCN